MQPTGKEVVAYIRLFDKCQPVSEDERQTFPGNTLTHDEAIKRGYISCVAECWRLTEEGKAFLKTLKVDYSPENTVWGIPVLTSELAAIRAHDVPYTEASFATYSLLENGQIFPNVPVSKHVPDGEVWIVDKSPEPVAKLSNIQIFQNQVYFNSELREPLRTIGMHLVLEKEK